MTAESVRPETGKRRIRDSKCRHHFSSSFATKGNQTNGAVMDWASGANKWFFSFKMQETRACSYSD